MASNKHDWGSTLATLKRYKKTNPALQKTQSGCVLIFAHGVGFSWTVDCQNHGEVAILNEKILVEHRGVLSIHDYAEALVILLRDPLGDSNPEYSRKDRFVLIGYSAVLSSLRPSIHHPSAEAHHTAVSKAFAAINNRHDIWPSREAAKAWLGHCFPWKSWDPEVLDIYVNHGLRPLPTAFYPDKTGGVTLSAIWVDKNATH
ncbi:uncharacterized protein EV420DRAFT_1481115 [Desarmillaria tabescens]|uniref:Uncharacterized protein n=1 Tax=Armillaria tabescens TaxID=1929756 RepID=A0AA39N354_ARMTA|nr:uncharacterized protein EV420DRAFT_1481115 [Desarmillaria tabescens]KAK0455659.1 hypothetical protein EV420DRAFT_1481115 [Desarmillaria tabescens]